MDLANLFLFWTLQEKNKVRQCFLANDSRSSHFYIDDDKMAN